jgi:hypothetical protein
MDAEPDGSCACCGNRLNHCDAGHCDKHIAELEKKLKNKETNYGAYDKGWSDAEKYYKKENQHLREALRHIASLDEMSGNKAKFYAEKALKEVEKDG